MRNKLFAIAAILLVSVVLLLPTTVEAVNLFRDACSQEGAGDSAACSGTGASGSNQIVDTINKATVLISIVAGAAAVLLLVIAGFMYASSGGDASKVESAKKTVIYTVVGLFVIVLARVIIWFVISSL